MILFSGFALAVLRQLYLALLYIISFPGLELAVLRQPYPILLYFIYYPKLVALVVLRQLSQLQYELAVKRQLKSNLPIFHLEKKLAVLRQHQYININILIYFLLLYVVLMLRVLWNLTELEV